MICAFDQRQRAILHAEEAFGVGYSMASTEATAEGPGLGTWMGSLGVVSISRSFGRSALVGLAATLAWSMAPLEAAAQTEDVTWRAPAGVTVSGNDLTKTTATAWGNSGAISLQSLESNGFVEFTAGGTAMLGLSKGDTNQDYTDIDFAVFVWSGTLYVYQSGNSMGSFGAVAPTDRFRVEVANGVVRYRKNGAVFYTSTLAARFPLLVARIDILQGRSA